MATYESLGVREVVNAAASLTALGGSLMSREVVAAMAEASTQFVDMHELQSAVGRDVASMTKNDAAWVTAGGAAGIVLSILAARSGNDLKQIARLPTHESLKDEVIMFTAHRIPYDQAVKLAGAKIIAVGSAKQVFDFELESAFSSKTAAILYVAGEKYQTGSLDLESTIRIAGNHGVPVIVDAAAQLPPKKNFWHYTVEAGADLAIFSGGKQLRGPQTTGLVVGKQHWIDAIQSHAAPFQRYARAMKVGKEELMGVHEAVRIFMEADPHEKFQELLDVCEHWSAEIATQDHVETRILRTNVSGAEYPRVLIDLGANNSKRIKNALWDLNPRIAVYSDHEERIYLEPEHVQPHHHDYVLSSVMAALREMS